MEGSYGGKSLHLTLHINAGAFVDFFRLQKFKMILVDGNMTTKPRGRGTPKRRSPSLTQGDIIYEQPLRNKR